MLDASALLTSEVFTKTPEITPQRDAEASRGLAGARWVWHPRAHLTGVAFVKTLDRAIPRDFDKPNSMARAIYKDEFAHISAHPMPLMRRSCPDFMICPMTRTSISRQSGGRNATPPFSKLQKDHPGPLIAPLSFGGNAVLIAWPESPDEQTVLGSHWQPSQPTA